MFDKETIKMELIEGSNSILKRYGEEYLVENVSVMNTKDNIIFLGSLKVFNELNVRKIEKDVENNFEDYGKITIRSSKVTSCCSMPYIHVTFHINIDGLL